MLSNTYLEHKKITKTVVDWLSAVGGIFAIFLPFFQLLFGGLINYFWTISYVLQSQGESANSESGKVKGVSFCEMVQIYLFNSSIWRRMFCCFLARKGVEKKSKLVKKKRKQLRESFNVVKLTSNLRKLLKNQSLIMRVLDSVLRKKTNNQPELKTLKLRQERRLEIPSDTGAEKDK